LPEAPLRWIGCFWSGALLKQQLPAVQCTACTCPGHTSGFWLMLDY
jgi:hypothetical protein